MCKGPRGCVAARDRKRSSETDNSSSPDRYGRIRRAHALHMAPVRNLSGLEWYCTTEAKKAGLLRREGKGRARAASHRQTPATGLKTAQRTIIGKYAWGQRCALCLGAHASAQHTEASPALGWRSTAQRGVVEAQASGQRVCKGLRGCVAARDRKRDGPFFVPCQVRA